MIIEQLSVHLLACLFKKFFHKKEFVIGHIA